MYSIPEIVEVPIDRLVKNLESQIANFEKDPEDAKYEWKKWDLIANLARLHAMSYALNLKTLKADKDEVHKDRLDPNYQGQKSLSGRYFPETLPSQATNPKAKAHLAEAIRLYRLALTNERTEWTAKMGLAWCLQQDGKFEEAKQFYRQVIKSNQAAVDQSTSDILKYVLKMPITNDAIRIQALVDGKEVFNKNIYSLSLRDIAGAGPKYMSAYSGKPYTQAEKTAIDSALVEVEKAFDTGKFSDQKQSVDKLRSTIETADARMYTNPKEEIRLPRESVVNAINSLWEIYTSKIEAPNARAFYMSLDAADDGSMNLDSDAGHVVKLPANSIGPKALTPISFGDRQGPPVKYEFKILGANNRVLDSIQQNVPTKKSFSKYEAPPADFTIKSQLGKIGTAETALYLIQILDAKKDAEEIENMRKIVWVEKKKEDQMTARFITPIAIPLRADVSYQDMIDEKAAVAFDLDGTRSPQRWTWISENAGWLVYIPTGHDLTKIDSAIYLFGSVSFWIFWKNGYQALCALDDNGDGKLTGAELDHIGIWNDANSNGKSEAGEVRPLFDYGINALSCAHEKHAQSKSVWSRDGVQFTNGTTRPSYDLILRSR